MAKGSLPISRLIGTDAGVFQLWSPDYPALPQKGKKATRRECGTLCIRQNASTNGTNSFMSHAKYECTPRP